ncbi:hypothetical protein OHA70_05840 [Kribbella sp. NBC_00382]|uniref:hypothetical protein n=1 Tax=Kribbella sp. NBC_00382 TaxID=2975967 RepID=UPI002E1B0E60
MSAGRLIPRDSPEHAWVSSIVRSVEKLTGRPSRWNGDLYEETRPEAAGSALDGGGMTINPTKVLAPAGKAYGAGRQLDEDELAEARDAVLTVVHEAKHLSNPLGDENAPGATPVHSADTVALDEGLTENWAHENVDDVIQDIGMDQYQPELLNTESIDSYPAYTSATDELVRGTADVTGLSQSQVVDVLEQADRTQRWAALADLVIDERLADVLPEEDREAVRTQLVQTMRPHLGDVVATEESEVLTDLEKRIGGHRNAEDAVTGLSTTTAGLEEQYRNAGAQPQQSAEVDHLRKFLGGAPPQAGSYRGAQGDGAVPDNVRALRGRPEQGQSPAR